MSGQIYFFSTRMKHGKGHPITILHFLFFSSYFCFPLNIGMSLKWMFMERDWISFTHHTHFIHLSKSCIEICAATPI